MSESKQRGPGQEQTSGRDRRAAYVEALKAERRGYEVRGLKERVAQVDEQIARLVGDAKPAPQTSRAKG